MKIHDIIRTRRQALGLTQEGLADRLGVSAPAVNKWERESNYPDITLLPTLARVLGVDLNTLLSFQEDMSREDISQFLLTLSETARDSGCAAAFQLARDKLREFPGNDLLAYNTAGVLEGVLALYPLDDRAEQEDRQQEITALYERAAASGDPKVREWASYTLAARCISGGELDRAEALLGQLSDTHRDKRSLTASLRSRQGRKEEARVLLEQELLDRACGIQAVLLHLTGLALSEGETEWARALSDTAIRAGEAMDLDGYAVLPAPLQLALADQDGPRTLALLRELLDSIAAPHRLRTSPLYRHLPVKAPEGRVQRALLSHMLDQLETDPECRFLQAVPGYQDLTAAYRNAGV